MSPLTQFMLILVVQSIVISALAYGAIHIVRRDCNKVHAVGLAAIILMLISPILMIVIPFDGLYVRAFQQPESSAQVLSTTSVEIIKHQSHVSNIDNVPASPAPSEVSNQAISNFAPAQFDPPAIIATEPTSKPIEATQFSTQNAITLLAMIWALVVAYLILVRLYRYLRLRAEILRARTTELPSDVIQHLHNVFGRNVVSQVRITEILPVPFVFGVLKPTIVIPENVWNSIEHRQDVITHEAAHIYRRDPWSHLAQRFASLLYWWNPMVHAVNRHLSDAREMIADNYVLRRTSSSSYASTLLAIAEDCLTARFTAPALAFLSSKSTLEQRIGSLLDECRSLNVHASKRTRSLVVAASIALVCFGGGIGTSKLGLFAQEKSDTDAKATSDNAASNQSQEVLDPQLPLSASGRILDSKGNPVPDCLLLVQVKERDGTEQTLSTRSGADGKYKIGLPAITHLNSHFGWAYKEGYNLRTVFFAVPFRKQKVANDLDITLPDQQVTEVSVLSPEGKPVADATIRPSRYWVPMSQFADIPEDPSRVGKPIPEELFKQFQGVTDVEGKAKLTGISASLTFEVRTASSVYGEQEFGQGMITWLDFSGPFTLSSTRSVHGALLASNPARWQGKVIELRTKGGLVSPNHPTREGVNHRFPRFYGGGYARAVIDANGEFHIPAMAIGEVIPSFERWGSNEVVVPVLTTKQPPILNARNAKEDLNLEFNLTRTIQLQGRLLKGDTKEPIQDAYVGVFNRTTSTHAESCTDSQGMFSVRVPPGAAQVQFNFLSSELENYDLPRDLKINVDPLEDTMQLNDLLAEPWPLWKLHVSSVEGNPIANRDVALTYQPKERPRVLYRRGKSDANGNVDIRLSNQAKPVIDKGEFVFYLIGSADATDVDPNGQLKVDRRNENEVWLTQVASEPFKNTSTPPGDSKQRTDKSNDQSKALDAQVPRTASGRILDTKSNPVADCLLVAELEDKSEIAVRSDEKGNYSITFPAEKHFPGSYRAWAYKQGYNARPLQFGKHLGKQQNATGLDIVLPELTSLQVEVFSPTGEPLKSAVVSPYYYELPNGSFSSDEPEGVGGPPARSVLQKTSALTDDQGRTTLSGYAPQFIGGLLVKTSEYGDQICYASTKEPLLTLNLRPVGSIRGTLVTDNPKRFEGQVLRLQGNRGLPDQVRSDAYVKFDGSGHFHIPAFSVGELDIRSYDWNTEFEVMPILSSPAKPEVRASEELNLEFSLTPAAKISGRLVKADTREPIPDACMSLWNTDAIANPRIYTKQDGSFVGYVIPGSIQVSVTSFAAIESGYDYPERASVETSGNEIDLGDLAAPPFREVVFRLRTPDSEPIVNRDFGIASLRSDRPPNVYLKARTNELGIAKIKINKFTWAELTRNDVSRDAFSARQSRPGFFLLDDSQSNNADPNNKLRIKSIGSNEIQLMSSRPR